MKPVKMMSVAWPRIFGPSTLKATLTTPITTIRIAISRSARR